MTNAARTDAVPTIATAVAVTRTRMPAGRRRRAHPRKLPRRSATVGRQSVPGHADGLDPVPVERAVELGAQVPDVDLHDVEIPVEAPVPHVVEDVGLRNDVAAATEQELQERHLARCERNLDLA